MGLITDRTNEDVLRRNALALKGRAGMTDEEFLEWHGHPMATPRSNLFATGPYYSAYVTLEYLNGSIVARGITQDAPTMGQFTYAISLIGEAHFYAGKTLTLSVDSVTGTGKAQIALYWYDDNGAESAGGTLTGAGSTTFVLSPNRENRAYLAAYVYITTFSPEPITSALYTEYHGVMLTRGEERHEYVPYVDFIPTSATKGAYNYYDLNRVENAVAEISDSLGLGLITKTYWSVWDVPRMSDWKRYLHNVRVIKNVTGSSIALPKIGDKFTFSDANNIESILSDAYAATESDLRCGDVYCGDLN